MNMTVSVTDSNAGEVVIAVTGRFDFSQHEAFRDAYRSRSSDRMFVVDLSKTEFIDSSALGMLLLLREYAGVSGPAVKVTGCCDSVRHILELAQFDTLFELEADMPIAAVAN
jgi:anti-anti-sigma factor